jgi:ABC-type branched-subunit amino acid transport system permease subunit
MRDLITGLLASLLDIRVVIGGLFTIYGVILTITGLVDGPEARAKAEGVDINLWVGLAMLAFGLCFLVWSMLNPKRQVHQAEHPEDD